MSQLLAMRHRTPLTTFSTFRPALGHSRNFYHRRAPEKSTEITELLARYESSPALPLNLAQLLSFGQPVTPASVLSSVTYALSELPRRIAYRVRSLEALPFIVGTNPYVTKTLDSYRESFQWLATHPEVTNLEENNDFVEQLAALVQRHANDIPTMAKGCVLGTLGERILLTLALVSKNALGICLPSKSATS